MWMWNRYNQLPGSTQNNKSVAVAAGVGGLLILLGLGYVIWDAIKDARLEDQLQDMPMQLNILKQGISEFYSSMPSKEMIYVKSTSAAYNLSNYLKF